MEWYEDTLLSKVLNKGTRKSHKYVEEDLREWRELKLRRRAGWMEQ